jgi:hypothetical protein
LVVGFGTIYGAVQQAQRSDANYPQVQLAEDMAASLDKDVLPSRYLGENVDMAKSLAPFTIVYRKDGSILQGSGLLNGKVPKAPLGVLRHSTGKDYYAVTWQPAKDVRIAAVVVPAKDYFVLSGRNLKEVEKNESRTFDIALLGGVLAVLLLAVIFVASGGLNEED